jgi:hypothetical protein
MNKSQDFMRFIVSLALYLGFPVYLIWRADTYVDAHGDAMFLARVMCILLAVMLGMVGLVRGLEMFDPEASPDASSD